MAQKSHAQQVAELIAAAKLAASCDPNSLIEEKVAAKMLGVNHERLRRWRLDSDPVPIPFFKLPSGRVRYALADVLAARASMRVEA